MHDPLPPYPGMIRSRATKDGVIQTLPDGTERMIPEEVAQAMYDNLVASTIFPKSEPTHSYFRPTRLQRIRREIVRRFHMAMAAIHDALFSRYCCCSC